MEQRSYLFIYFLGSWDIAQHGLFLMFFTIKSCHFLTFSARSWNPLNLSCSFKVPPFLINSCWIISRGSCGDEGGAGRRAHVSGGPN